jgi:hypothetical protein
MIETSTDPNIEEVKESRKLPSFSSNVYVKADNKIFRNGGGNNEGGKTFLLPQSKIDYKSNDILKR